MKLRYRERVLGPSATSRARSRKIFKTNPLKCVSGLQRLRQTLTLGTKTIQKLMESAVSLSCQHNRQRICNRKFKTCRGLHFVECLIWRNLGKCRLICGLGELKDTKISNAAIYHSLACQRQAAELLELVLVALSQVLHYNNHSRIRRNEVHGATHALDHPH